MSLSDGWHLIDGPGRESMEFWISGGGGDRWDEFQLQDESGSPENATDCEIEAEIRDDSDNLVATLDAEWVNEATASARVKATAELNAGLSAGIANAVPRGGRCRLGTYTVYVTDDQGRWPVKSGDAFGIRK